MRKAAKLAGSLVLMALTLCAFGAAAASAEGLTAYTCKEVVPGTGEYTDSHCTTAEPGNYSTVEIPINTATEVEGQAEGNTVLSATIAGIKTTITCTSAKREGGTIRNIEEGGMMRVHGTNTVVLFSGCSATAGAKACTVTGVTGGAGAGKIQTNPLTAITSFTVSPEAHSFTVSPEEGGATFGKFTLGGASCPAAISGEKTVAGSATGTVPTSKPTHATFEGKAGGKLLFGEVEAEFSGTITGTMKGTDQTLALKTS